MGYYPQESLEFGMHVLDLFAGDFEKTFCQGIDSSPSFTTSFFQASKSRKSNGLGCIKSWHILGDRLPKSSFEFSGILHVGPTKSLTFSRVFPKGCHSLFSLEGF